MNYLTGRLSQQQPERERETGQGGFLNESMLDIVSQMLRVCNIYLHLPKKHGSNVGKYSIHGLSGYVF